MKKVILTLMSLAVLSSATNLFADKTISVTNNNKNAIISLMYQTKNTPMQIKVATIKPHETQKIAVFDEINNTEVLYSFSTDNSNRYHATDLPDSIVLK